MAAADGREGDADPRARAPLVGRGGPLEAIPSAVATRRFLASESRMPRWATRRPERILYRSTRSGRWEFWLADLATGGLDRVSTRSRAIDAGAIDPSGRWVWLFEDRGGTEHGRWLIRRFDDEDAYLRTPDLPGGYAAGLALGTRMAIVGITDESGTTTITRLEVGRSPRHVATDRQMARVEGLDPTETRILVSRTSAEFRRHRELQVLDGAGDVVARLSDGPGFDVRARGWSPGEDDPRILVLHERRDFLRPALWDLEAGEVRDVAEDVDAAHDVEACWFPDGRRVLLLHHDRDGGRLEVADLASGRRTPLPAPALPAGAEILDAAVRPDDTVWLEWSTPASPRCVSSREATLIGPDEPIPERRATTWRDRAGDVPIVRTETPGGGRRPLVVLLHGGPAEQSRPIWSPEAESWSELGFRVIQPNYRGSSGCGRRWREAQRADPAWAELADLRRTVQWAVDAGLADPDRIVLDGRSWGGYLTLLALSVDPALWSLGIAELPMADPVALYGDAMPSIRRMDSAVFGGTPATRPWTYWERSPMTWAPRLDAPVLLIRSTRDPRCPPEQIDRYARRLHALGKRVDVVRIEGGHGPPTSVVRRDLFLRRIDFVRDTIGLPEPQDGTGTDPAAQRDDD